MKADGGVGELFCVGDIGGGDDVVVGEEADVVGSVGIEAGDGGDHAVFVCEREVAVKIGISERGGIGRRGSAIA